MKILWVGDSPEQQSAYSGQAALFIPRLRAAGHEVVILATGNAHAHRLPDGTQVLPVVSDRYGNSIVREHARRFGADLVFTLCDPHVLAPAVYAELPWCAWAPLDFETPTKVTLAVLKHAKWVWSPSKHGQRAYEAAGVKASWVPHGVDSKVFAPMDRDDARDLLGASIGADIPKDAFLAVAVAANRGSPSRKGFYEMFAAWKIFHEWHPDALLYLHTEVTGLGGVGEDLRAIADLVGLKEGSVLYPPQYEYVCGMLGQEHLVAAYSAADVYLSTSHGEGFGLPAAEAAMCGTRSIYPHNTAQTEVGAICSPYATRTTEYMPFDGATIWRRPVVSAVVESLEFFLGEEMPENRETSRNLAMVYDVDRVFTEYFLSALNKIAEELGK